MLTKRKIMDYDTPMKLYRKLYEASAETAEKVKVKKIYIGISYTAVLTSDGGCGISFTFLNEKRSCTTVKDPMDYEGGLAIKALIFFSAMK